MSQVGVDIGTYTFNASTKTITFSGVILTDISVISPIWNITKGVTIYNPAEVGKGFVSFNGTTLVLQFDTNAAGHANTDKLKICVNTEIPETVNVDFLEAYIGSSGISKAKVKIEIGETFTIDSSSQLTYKDAITFFTNLGTINNQGVLRFDSLDEFINEGTILNDNLIILD